MHSKNPAHSASRGRLKQQNTPITARLIGGGGCSSPRTMRSPPCPPSPPPSPEAGHATQASDPCSRAVHSEHRVHDTSGVPVAQWPAFRRSLGQDAGGGRPGGGLKDRTPRRIMSIFYYRRLQSSPYFRTKRLIEAHTSYQPEPGPHPGFSRRGEAEIVDRYSGQLGAKNQRQRKR